MTDFQRRLPYVRALVIWLLLIAGAVVLYKSSAQSADAPAVVQAREHRISPTEVGRIASLEVHEGEQVRKGQVLVRMDKSAIDAQIRTVEAELAHSSSSVHAAAISIEADTFSAQRVLQSELEQAEQQESQVRAVLQRDKAELNALGAELARERDLVAQGLARADRATELALRKEVLDKSVFSTASQLNAASKRIDAARQRLLQWKNQFSRKAEQDPLDKQLQPLRDAIQEKEALLSGLRKKREQTDIVAPVEGHVVNLQTRNGDVVQPSDTLLVVVESVASQVVAYVHESRRGALAAGQKVMIHKRTSQGGQILRPDPIEGSISAVSQAVTLFPTRFWVNPQIASWGYETYIRLPAGVNLLPGEAVDVRFTQDIASAVHHANESAQAPTTRLN